MLPFVYDKAPNLQNCITKHIEGNLQHVNQLKFANELGRRWSVIDSRMLSLLPDSGMRVNL